MAVTAFDSFGVLRVTPRRPTPLCLTAPDSFVGGSGVLSALEHSLTRPHLTVWRVTETMPDSLLEVFGIVFGLLGLFILVVQSVALIGGGIALMLGMIAFSWSLVAGVAFVYIGAILMVVLGGSTL